jgi:hypothetical protein
MPFDFNAPKIIWLLNFSILSVPYEGHSRNTQWDFNMDWRILVFYPELEARDKMYYYPPTHVKTQNNFWLPGSISILICLRVQIR